MTIGAHGGGEAAVARPALVFLCQRLPYPPNTGERITTYNLIRYLTTRYRVFVGTFSDDPAEGAEIEQLRTLVAGLHTTPIRRPWVFARALPLWLTGTPVSYAIYRSRRLGAWLDEVYAREQPSVIVVHSSSVATYAVDRKTHAGAKPRTVLHFADVDSEKFLEYSRRTSGPRKWFYAQEGRRVRREERRLAELADRVTLVSATETELFRSAVWDAPERLSTLPNGVDLDVFRRDAYPQAPFKKTGPTLIFSGAMDYAPNADAACWFAEAVFPSIRRELPTAQFIIVGSKPTHDVRQLASRSGVQVTGRVPSVAEYLAHADIAVAPLRIARGVQNKVLEAMAMGLPTVVSPGALGGLTAVVGVHLRSAQAPDEWRDVCLHLLRSADEAAKLGAAARQHVEREYSWQAQFERLDGLLGASMPGEPAGS